MRRVLLSIGLAPLLMTVLGAQTPTLPVQPASPKRPLTELPYTPGLDVTSLDRTADPCVDFYKFSCGNWQTKNPIPPDQARWSVYGKLSDENEQLLWGLLEQAARPDAGRSASEQKIGDFFASCMDEAKVDADGAAPVLTELKAIDALTSKSALAGYMGRQQLSLGDDGLGFGFGSNQDLRRLVTRHRVRGRRRSRPARSRLLHQDRPTLHRPASEVRRACGPDVPAVGRAAGSRGRPRALGDGARDPARAGVVDQCRQAGSLQAAPQDGPHGPRQIDAGVRVGRLPGGAGHHRCQCLQRDRARFLQSIECADREPSAVCVEDLPEMARARCARRRARKAIQSGELRVLFEDAPGRERTAPTLEAMRPDGRCDLGEALGRVFVEKTFSPETKKKTVEMTSTSRRPWHRKFAHSHG